MPTWQAWLAYDRCQRPRAPYLPALSSPREFALRSTALRGVTEIQAAAEARGRDAWTVRSVLRGTALCRTPSSAAEYIRTEPRRGRKYPTDYR